MRIYTFIDDHAQTTNAVISTIRKTVRTANASYLPLRERKGEKEDFLASMKSLQNSTLLNHPKSHNEFTPGLAPQAEVAKHPYALLAAIIDSCEDAIVSTDVQGIVTSWNGAANRMFGYTSEEILGQSILTLAPRELHEKELEILSRIRNGQGIERYQSVRVRKNGEQFDASLTVSPIRDDAGRIVGLSKIMRDISEHKRSDEDRFRLAAIVDSSDDAIISKTLDGIITSWNDAASRMFGYTAEEMVGQSILRLIPEALHYEEDQILRKMRAGERIEHYETTRVRKNGETFDISESISPIKDSTGRVIGASKIARDISDRKQIEKSLIQAEKLAATGRMAATVAHEINNPLESVINLIFLARKATAGNIKVHTYLLTAEKEIERVSHIARQTLGYYRDTSAPVELDVQQLIEDVLRIYEQKLHSNGISVECEFGKCRLIEISKGELIQVFSNVIANAIDAMPQGGSLRIQISETTDAEKPGLQIVIRDTGIGIPKEHQPRLFEPFFTTKGNLGTGIGLWVAKQLIENRGGRIALTSNTESANHGTSVSIYIPFMNPNLDGSMTKTKMRSSSS